MNILPAGNLVILRPEESQSRSAGGIVLAERYRPATQIWRVLDVGPGRLTKRGQRVPIELTRGDRVFTAQIPNTRHAFSDGVIVVDASEILAKVEG